MIAAVLTRPGQYDSPVSKAPREIEYALFARITRALQDAAHANEADAGIQAVVDNNRLWTELAADLSHSDNALPAELKRNLLGLALFSIRHGARILGDGGDVSTLIDINLNIMKGLRAGGRE
ncbi:MAG: flagellar biosynthesis regulator FlaF [Paracoccus sp. (in: a-proteobacteria)]|nr:flagellar biosynthesis regulator FlaF [Paracoccus sp. (in: a-proteobacteria)]